MSTTLIQLISDQTIQNLLPILRYKPQRLVHLVTPKTKSRSSALEVAARAVGIRATIDVVELSAMPGIDESRQAVEAVLGQLANEERAIVNFTGGTKLMSIGAYDAAKAGGFASVYVDTQDACFVDGATGDATVVGLKVDHSFRSIHRQLNVDLIAKANGVQRITQSRDWRAQLPLAQWLFNHAAVEQRVQDTLFGPQGMFPAGAQPKNAKGWLAALDRPISLPEDVARLAVDSGLMRPGDNIEQVLLPDATRDQLAVVQPGQLGDYFKASRPIQDAVAFLTGGWWEVIVCDALQRNGQMRDLRWSCDVGDRNGPEVEEDVLALDGVELLYVSCKRGGARSRLLPLLEEIRARASTIGGSFNRRFLALCMPPFGPVAQNLYQQADRLGIRIVTGRDIYRDGVFSR